jgi:uncharacterized coiled-coil protein SlyX
MKQTQSINASLTALSNVLRALANQNTEAIATSASSTPIANTNIIPYRNNKLTRLLQDSLGGNSKTLFIVNVAPESECYHETRMSLRYGTIARLVRTTATVDNVSIAADVDNIATTKRLTHSGRKVALPTLTTSTPSTTVANSTATTSASATTSKKLVFTTNGAPSSAARVRTPSWQAQAQANATSTTPAVIVEAEKLSQLKAQVHEFQQQFVKATKYLEREREKRLTAYSHVRSLVHRVETDSTVASIERSRWKTRLSVAQLRNQTDFAQVLWQKSQVEHALSLERLQSHQSAVQLELSRIELAEQQCTAARTLRLQALSLESQVEQLKRDNAQALQHHDTQVRSEVRELELEVAQEKKRSNKIEAKLFKCQQRLTAHEQQVAQSAKSIDSLSGTVSSLTQDKQQLQSQCDSLREQLDSATNADDTNQEVLQQQRRKYRDKIKLLLQDNQERCDELTRATEQIQTLQEQLSTIQEQQTTTATAAAPAKTKKKSTRATKNAAKSEPEPEPEPEVQVDVESEIEVTPDECEAEHEAEHEIVIVAPKPKAATKPTKRVQTKATTTIASAAPVASKSTTVGSKRKRVVAYSEEHAAPAAEVAQPATTATASLPANKKRRLLPTGKQTACVLSPVVDATNRRREPRASSNKSSSAAAAGASSLRGASSTNELLANLFKSSFTTAASRSSTLQKENATSL